MKFHTDKLKHSWEGGKSSNNIETLKITFWFRPYISFFVRTMLAKIWLIKKMLNMFLTISVTCILIFYKTYVTALIVVYINKLRYNSAYDLGAILMHFMVYDLPIFLRYVLLGWFVKWYSTLSRLLHTTYSVDHSIQHCKMIF